MDHSSLQFVVLGLSMFTIPAQTTAQKPLPIADIVFGNNQAVEIRLRLRTDGNDWRPRFEQAQTAYVRKLFAHLDKNGDASLDKNEAVSAPPPQLLLSEAITGDDGESVNVAFNYRVLDDNGDGRVSVDELAEYYAYFGDGAVRLRRFSPQTTTTGGDLFERLDADGDGFLSQAELETTAKLFQWDANANDAVSLEELAPGEISRSNVQVEQANITLAAPNDTPADVEISLLLQDEKPESPFTFSLRAVSANPSIISVRETANDSVIMAAKGEVSERASGPETGRQMRIELQYSPGRLRDVSRQQSALRRDFAAADEDGDRTIRTNDKLTPRLKEVFGLIDQSGDGCVSEKELTSYVEELLPLEADVRRHRLTLYVWPRSNRLFDLLDASRDGRLGLREVRQAAKTSMTFDSNGDGKLAREEVPVSVKMLLVRGSLPSPAASVHDAGPPWFYRMDQNRDGDVSPREFLGAAELFHRLDADHDGLLALDEAIRAEDEKDEEQKYQGTEK